VANLYEASDQQLLLAARPQSRLQRRVAQGVMAGLLAIFCITVPYADLPLQPVPAFIPVYATAMAIIDLITATLIFAQFWVARWTWLLVLASGFFFTAVIAIPFALTFPGAFAPSGLLGAGTQTAAWLSACWHLGSPAFLIVAILVRGSRETASTWQRSPGLAIALGVALVAAIVCGLTWAILAYGEILPWIYVYRIPGHNNVDLLMPMIVLSVIAFVLLWMWGRSVLDLWLMVMCSSWVFELSLSGIISGSRYTLGWYSGRLFELPAAIIVLLLFLSEMTALYANLARASIQRRGARQARQIAMDAMAASLGHEIRQPLMAVLVNAHTALQQVSEAEPDLKEIHATISDIATDGQRIEEIIGGVRTMFKGSAHYRQLLDVNKVVRDALATVDLELRQQRVIVKTDLDNDLPPALADNGQLHQVFLNLITNALEAMAAIADRPCVLRLTSGVVADTSDVRITVEDTGVGIADKDNSRILEPFFSTKVAGTGVGLTICKVIIEAHGGSLQVFANEPHGTIFCVTLPTGDAD
jgi:signal transduction histidine kinase